MKRLTLAALALVVTMGATAQDKTAKQLFTKPKFSGFVMGQYSASWQDCNESNSFNIRMARVSVGGRILDNFEYKVQGQINGNTTTLGNSPRIVDAFVEWQKHKAFKVKVGQFKRPFTFENPMNPIDQGFNGYGQVINKLSGFNDRTGEHASNGRDIGVQLQGDFLPNANGRNLLHYQVGVFNGQGTNMKDVDNKKDLIGGVWVMPVEGMRIGAFGWTGTHARNGAYTNADGTVGSGVVSLRQYRYALSAEYKTGETQLRAEYIHSTGYGFKTTYQDSDDAKDATVNYAKGNKADGFYALAIVPVVKQKLRAKARYNLYRDKAEWSSAKTQYEIGLNYLFHKNLELQTEYIFTNDRSLAKSNYSGLDVEICVRF